MVCFQLDCREILAVFSHSSSSSHSLSLSLGLLCLVVFSPVFHFLFSFPVHVSLLIYS